MNTRRKLQVFLASALGGAILLLALWLLSSTVLQPVVAHEIEGATLQTLPPPFLNYDDVADAPFDNPPSPVVDGLIAPGEYAGAGKVTFPGYGGDVEVFFKEDGAFLYVAFELPDKVNHIPVPNVSIYLDTNNDGGSAPQTDDFRLQVWRNGGVAEWQGNGAGWNSNTSITWTYGFVETMSGWSAEFGIPFTKLGISAGIFKELGLALSNGGPGSTYYWPAGADGANPDTWGALVSSSDWGNFYWKPGPWEDYAPSGMPDFDQNQQGWLAYDGPAAAANSLWWFDSKFETLTGTMPPMISDTYRLVRSYGLWDDHHYSNTVPLLDDLAQNYFGTNQGITGTDPINMFHGIHRYLRDKGLWDDYIVTLVDHPAFEWVADEVMRSEDVILLLGFYEWRELEGRWARVGGHYVNVAGVDPIWGQIAFSDPAMDAFENGLTLSGRVLSGTLILPHQPGHASYVHNDAGNVSHDVYYFMPTNSPGGDWGPEGYPWWMAIEMGLIGANPNPLIDMEEYEGTELQVEVEVALAVSPYTWKASGEWLPDDDDPIWGVWQPWQDYAPNGMPDFDQKQDGWGLMGPMGWQWTFCGPAAAANSLWWFDSKFEPTPVGPTPPPPSTIPYNDNYPLVQSYDSTDPLWDDHDPLNVDDPATLWPPGGEFVEDLAMRFDTDGIASGAIHAGTIITDVYTGIEAYITDHGLRQGYVITQVKSPDFWWVAEEVEVSEDVILLLGFWQNQNPGPDDPHWVRLGGHYVTLPGVDKKGGLVAFSDSYYDGAEYAWPYAYPNGWPTVMGRVADGWLIPHPPYHSHVSTVHNDAGNISHDVYYVAPTDSPGGVWGPEGYVEGWSSIENFWGQNGQEDAPPVTLDPIQTEVDWAVAVSPVADVYVRKEITPPVVLPGDWVTFTINFGNEGSLPAENVVITDTLPTGLINASWSAWVSNGLSVKHRSGTTYVWDLPDLAWREWGAITITAQVSSAASGIIANTAEIATSSVEQYQVTPLPNSATATFTIQTADVTIAKSVQPPNVAPGDWVTYTIVYTNHGQLAAANTVITDLLHSWLGNSSYSIWTSYPAVLPSTTGNYVWAMGSVPAGGRGIITVTAQVSPSLSGGGSLLNNVSIATTTPERDYTNNSANASNIVVYYDVDLQPDTGFAADNPGKTVTYTLTLYNTGNADDTYTLSKAGDIWTTTMPVSLGPVLAGGNAQFQVTVQIPGSASSGDHDTVTVTATSQGDPTKSDASVLTTTAQSGTITYGVALAPATASQLGTVGQTITYTLRVTNTGSVADTISLGYTSSNTWSVTLLPAAVGLGAGVGADVVVTVDIPATAAPGSTGVVTVTATSQGDPTKSDTSILTTTAQSGAPTYSMDLQPDTGFATDNPGETVTYRLTLRNTGNANDTYTLSKAGNSWTTTNPPASFGVPAGGSVQFQMTVQIPGGAASGDHDTVTVTAISQGDPTQSDASVFTTTAQSGTITRGVVLTGAVTAQEGIIGDWVTYTLRVTNTGNVADFINLTPQGSGWPVGLSAYGVSLGTGQGADVQAYVQVPFTASDGATDTVTVKATSANDTTATDNVVLTTTARWPRLYLPLVLRKYTP